MSSQPPVRFENYPPEPEPGLPLLENPEPAAQVFFQPPPSGSVPEVQPAAAAPAGPSRRALIVGLAIGVPFAGILGMAVLGDGGEGDEGDSGDDQLVEVGRFQTTLPLGWNVVEQTDVRLGLGKGDNFVYAIPELLAASSRAVDDLGPLVDAAVMEISRFRGSPGPAVDSSTASLQRAELHGDGSLNGRPARLLAKLWMDRDGEGLLVIRILTSAANTADSWDAQNMTDQLSSDFG